MAFTNEEYTRRGDKAQNLADTPLLMALAALGLLLVGIVLGATGAHLATAPQVHGHVWGHAHSRFAGSPAELASKATDTDHEAMRPSSGSHHSTRLSVDQQPHMQSLESIMYHYQTDMSKDDKKYSDLFAMLFDPIRLKVSNVTEVGMGNGGSVMTWHDYFRKANIYGMDEDLSRVKDYLSGLPRIHLLKANPVEAQVGALGLLPGSMDVVFESAGRGLKAQERILPVLWPLVRPGGYYVIEDVGWDKDIDQRAYPLLHEPEKLPKMVRDIISQNDAFFADTTLGHRAFNEYIRDAPGDLNRFSHTAHVIVIRKRTEPLRAVSVNSRALPAVAEPAMPEAQPQTRGSGWQIPERSYDRRQRQLLGLP